MVTTRRGSRQGSAESSQGSEPSGSSQREAPAQRGCRSQRGRGRGRGRSAARAAPAEPESQELQTIEENVALLDTARIVVAEPGTAEPTGEQAKADAVAKGNHGNSTDQPPTAAHLLEAPPESSDDSSAGDEEDTLAADNHGNGPTEQPVTTEACEAASESFGEGSDSDEDNTCADGDQVDGAAGQLSDESSDGDKQDVSYEGNHGNGTAELPAMAEAVKASSESLGESSDNGGSDACADDDYGDSGAKQPAAQEEAGMPMSQSSGERSDGDSDDGDDDEALLGPNLVDQLASSLKEALQARGGGREASPPMPGAESAGQRLGLTSDPAAIRWQTEVAEKKAAGQKALRRAAPGAGAVKEKGLAQQLLAPPRVKAVEKGSSTSETSKRWFQLPATKITDSVKQELRLLRLRGAYDPKRFYKSFDETKFPKHFQIGTVLDNPQDFYSSRLTARERGATITQELLADSAVAVARKKRYAKLQEAAMRHHKVKKRKTDLVRANPKPKRPKH